MARGWESKSVEGQIESFENDQSAEAKRRLTPDQAEKMRMKGGLKLARAKVLRDLESAENPRYRDMLNAALADLDAKLSKLD